MKRVLAAAVILLVALPAWAQAPVTDATSIEAENPALSGVPGFNLERFVEQKTGALEAPDIRVGDRLILRIVGLPGEGKGFDIDPGPTDLTHDPWIERGMQVLENKDGLIVVTPLKPGKLAIPPLPIRDSAGKTVGKTLAFNYEAASAIRADDPSPKDPAVTAPPVSLGFPWWVIIAGLLLLGGLGLLLWYWLKRRRKKIVVVAAPVVLAPRISEDEWALQALARLEKDRLSERGEHKRHYFSVSDILKRYLGERFEFEAQESTTHELIERLEHGVGAEARVIDQVESLFKELDRVKFTDQIPSTRDAQFVLERARELVTSTRKPKPAPVTVNAAAPSANVGGRK